MNKNEKRTNFIFKMSIIGLVILTLHFCTIFISRTQLINNTEIITGFTKNQARIQRVVKNELSNFEKDLALDSITQELEMVAGTLKPSFDLSSKFNDYVSEWNSLKSIIYDYRETNDNELYYRIIIQSELVWHNGDKILDSLNNKMHKDLNVFWLMFILLLISIICFVFIFIYIWKTVRGSLMGLALRDPLTNCFNRNYLNEYYVEQLKLYNRYGHVFSVAMLDLDDFKKVNDQFGHDVGDLVLKRFVKLIRDRIRSSDILVRYGGEEFLILFPDTELEDAKILSEKIVKYVSDCTSFESGKITTSIGLASIKVSDYTSRDVIKEADMALYQAKANGKNQVATYFQS